MNLELKSQAIKLRRNGFSYSEILRTVPVAKSTLSLWLRSVGLSKRQKQRLTEKKLVACKLGGQARKNKRLKITEEIKRQAYSEIKAINKEKLWLMGIMLYWAEGSKEKVYSGGQNVIFSNSDKFMVRLFIKWLKECVNIEEEMITFQIYVHENHKERLKIIIDYWSKATGFPKVKFDKIYYKKHRPSSLRKNAGNDYFGLIRIRIKQSTNLNRKIAGWIEGICFQCGVV